MDLERVLSRYLSPLPAWLEGQRHHGLTACWIIDLIHSADVMVILSQVDSQSFQFPHIVMHLAGFYLRKTVAGSTLKIEGSIFGAKPQMRGGRAQEGGVPPLGGGVGGPPRRKF